MPRYQVTIPDECKVGSVIAVRQAIKATWEKFGATPDVDAPNGFHEAGAFCWIFYSVKELDLKEIRESYPVELAEMRNVELLEQEKVTE